MNRIRLLPEPVANQIAAGEVVERPSSVVKELIENALDAQARSVSVEILAGGRSLIRVTDDGVGMSRDDALLCLERHATSKIQSAQDLDSIATLGFRGEALPSIASVSRFVLTTREHDPEIVAATQVQIQGGKIIEVKAAGAPPGTCVEVRQLFFNLPARRKFLRSEETERAHIQHYLVLAALAFPEVAFTFVDNQRLVWRLPPLRSGPEAEVQLAALRERMQGIHGPDPGLLAVDYSMTLPAEAMQNGEPIVAQSTARLRGLIGAPGISRATRENQHLFVNRRPIENRGLNMALLEGYHTALMKGRFPVACLFLEINPAEVDVNIHPAKREVKFRQEKAVRHLVGQAVRAALQRFHAASRSTPSPAAWPAQATSTVESTASALASAMAAPEAASKPSSDIEPPRPTPHRQPDFPLAGSMTRLVSPLSTPDPLSGHAPAIPTGLPRPSMAAPDERPAVISPAPANQAGEPLPLLSISLRLLGVVGRLYVVMESDRGLVLLDQHAAHERILFEQMLSRLEREETASQRLLLPETLELAPRDAQFLREQLATLTRLGIGLSEFGERTFLLDALPPFVRGGDARQFVLDVLDELKAAGPGVNPLRLGEQTVAKTVCRHAVKAHDPLSPVELEQLLEDLRHCVMPYTCPHGRPTLIELSFRELEKKFGRVV
jgi:DNA mismatch repair protein MutL